MIESTTVDEAERKRARAERSLYKRLVISHFDLAETRQFIFKLLGTDGANPPDPADKVVCSALHTALIVSYARPFSGNAESDDVQSEIPGRFVRELSPDELRLHEYMLRRRNEEFAHSDPSAADVKIRVDELTPGVPCATPVSNVTRNPLSPAALSALDEICERFYKRIHAEMLRLQARFRPGEHF